ncbi:MAG: gamma-glutamyltransferase, partial [Acetobacteraceae bacterium]|nr:gamma-glutamyltransferase [Acetobacteraceae bacterium]
MPHLGWESVTVPGAVAAWAELSRRFGRLNLEQVAAPAIRFARDGFAVTPTVARIWAQAAQSLGDQPGFAECFLPGGRPPRAGEVFRSEAHARTLEIIAASGG